MRPDIDLVVEAGQWHAAGDVERVARIAVEAALAELPASSGAGLAVTVLLTDDAHIRALNKDWRGQDKATNVLSFPSGMPAIAGEPRPLGDIALAAETLAREAEAEGKSLADHMIHLIVHGVLHLCAFDHETPAEAEAMEALEIRALARIGVADPYRDAAA